MGGSGSGDSTSILTGGGTDISKAVGQVNKSTSENGQTKKLTADGRAEMAKEDAARIAVLQAKVNALIAGNPKLSDYRNQIKMEITPDGLQIQIVDDQSRPMFDSGSAAVKPYMREILREIGAALNGVENRVSLTGHTDAAPYGNGERGYGNWELSVDRANATRRELVASGMPDDKLARVMGLASSNLLDEQNPLNPINRRISIIVMTREAEARLMGKPELLPAQPAPEPVATTPKAPASSQ